MTKMWKPMLEGRLVKLGGVLLAAFVLKLHYSTASVDQLRWILEPTAVLVEVVTGRSFVFEARAGYMSEDHRFLIAASCAGVNFLITAFLMLGLGRLWQTRSELIGWTFLPASGLYAFVATLVANTIRISIALYLQNHPLDNSWLTPAQFHRLEGIVVYFGVLLSLFLLTNRRHACPGRVEMHGDWTGEVKPLLFPLAVYYATTVLLPMLNGAYEQGQGFWAHIVVVLVTPVFISLLFFGLLRLRRVNHAKPSIPPA